MTYGEQILSLIQYQIDLQFGRRMAPVSLAAGTFTSTLNNWFYYSIQANGSADLVLTSAKDINGSAITALTNFTIPAGGKLDGCFSEIVVTSGTGVVQCAPFFDALQSIKQ